MHNTQKKKVFGVFKLKKTSKPSSVWQTAQDYNENLSQNNFVPSSP